MDQRQAAAGKEPRREQLFTERYESLLAWALRLTNHHHEAAEDLVQDAFVQFMLGRTGLEQIENIDGYLRRMLRYMHASRMNRQAQRLHEITLSVADSIDQGWTAVEPARRMQALEELQSICSYACARKEASRAAGVLILRCFLEYSPAEIARIIGSSRHCVDQLQGLARREVKLFMNQPGRLRFFTKRAAQHPVVKNFGSSLDLMVDVRRMVFLSRQGACPAPEDLREIYSSGDTEALTTPRLAHIVSCPTCLDAVNSLLGLPLLAHRYQPVRDQPTPDNTEGASGDVGKKVAKNVRKKFSGHLRAISEHKPQRLRIAVNGFHVGAMKISSDTSELIFYLNSDEAIEFIEITSEHGVQLLFLSSGNGSESNQWAWIELSEGRTLAAYLRSRDMPGLRVVYQHPLPRALFVNQAIRTVESLTSLVPADDETSESKVATQRHVTLLRPWTMSALGSLKRADGSAGAGDPRADLNAAE